MTAPVRRRVSDPERVRDHLFRTRVLVAVIAFCALVWIGVAIAVTSIWGGG